MANVSRRAGNNLLQVRNSFYMFCSTYLNKYLEYVIIFKVVVCTFYFFIRYPLGGVMENFEYYMPVKVIFGKDTETQVGAEVKRFGKKVLLHYGGGSIKRSGLYDKIVESLNKDGIEFVELGGVEPNPRLSLVRKGIDICKTQGIDLVLAVGGGSVIDSAKAIAFGALSDKDVWEEFYLNKVPVEESLPVGVVLTIPAAGSECSRGTVISNEETQRKLPARGPAILPKFAILNPELTKTLPAFHTACGASDMIAHIMERYFTNTEHVDLTDRMCEATMTCIIDNALLVIENPDNYDYRAEIMLCGTIAHNNSLGIGRVQDWMSHGMEHELSAVYDVAHGEGLAIIFPAWIKYCSTVNMPRFVRFAEKVCGITQGSDEEKVDLAVEYLRNWYSKLGLKTKLSDYDFFDEAVIESMAKACIDEGIWGGIKEFTVEDIIAIYKLAL